MLIKNFKGKPCKAIIAVKTKVRGGPPMVIRPNFD